MAHSKQEDILSKKVDIKWHPPDTLCLKINVDAGWCKSGNFWVCAAVARDSRENCKGFRSKLVHASVEPFVAELMAVKEGLRLGMDLDAGRFGVESDCKNVVIAASSPPVGCFDWDSLL